MPFGAIIGGVLGLGGSLISSSASSSAAQAQAQAAQAAVQAQQQEFATTQQNLAPYMQTGVGGNQTLNSLVLGGYPSGTGPLGPLATNPTSVLGPAPTFTPPPAFTPMTTATFQQSPGYNYQLQQTNQAITNSAAGQTGAISGNTLAALQSNAYGLANQDWYNANNLYNQNYLLGYNTDVNNYNLTNQAYWQNYNALNNYNMQTFNQLYDISGTGQNAAANLGGLGQQNVNAQTNAMMTGASATAAGILGSANAITGAITSPQVNNALTSPSVTNALTTAFNSLTGANPGAGQTQPYYPTTGYSSGYPSADYGSPY